MTGTLCQWTTSIYIISISSGGGVDRVENAKITTVIRKLKQHKAKYGTMFTLISDDGPQFVSGESKLFTEQWDIENRTSSSHFLLSNGMA